MISSTQETQLPDLQDEYSLPAQAAQSYARDGHILLRDVASRAEVEAYHGVMREVVERHNANTAPMGERDTYSKAFIQIGDLWRKDERVARFVMARRFAKIAAELMGADAVRLYHDQALWKEPGGGHTPWHQDQYYWPLDTAQTITMWMPLVDISAEMGTMSFASGSHRNGSLGALAISDQSEEFFARLLQERDWKTVNSGAMQAGDATWHSGWTLHGAPANQTDKMRAVMTIIYFADGARIVPPDNKGREYDLKSYFPNLRPGDIAASELTPLVYQRERR